MRFIFPSHGKNRKTNWFAWGIFLYIVIGSAWLYSQLPNGKDAQKKQEISVTDEEKITETFPVIREKKLQGHAPNNVGATEDVFVGTAQVTSGKTFNLITPVSETWRKRIVRRIQLYGVDTCETRQTAKRNDQEWPCGAVATAWLVAKTLDREVICRPSIVRSGVTFAQCFVEGIDLAEIGLSDGILLISKDKDNQPPSQYIGLEEEAKSKRLGLWSSDFDDPVQWRRNNGTYNPFDPR